MKTNNNASSWINQAFYFISLAEKTITDVIDVSYQHHTFLASLLAKMTMCNLTMSKKLTMSQDWIAQQIGCCDRTVRRHLNRLVELGFLKKISRGFKQTNEYTINPIAKTENFLKLLAPHFHEVQLYLTRTFRERLRKKLDIIAQKAILVKQAANQLIQKGVLRLKIMNNIYINNNNYKEIIMNYSQNVIERLTKLLNCSQEQIPSLMRYSSKVLNMAEKAYLSGRAVANVATVDRFRYFIGICKRKARDLGEPVGYPSAKELDERIANLSQENNSVHIKKIMNGESLKQAQAHFIKQKIALDNERRIGQADRDYERYLQDEEEYYNPKEGTATASSSFNAQPSYRKHSGERPSLATTKEHHVNDISSRSTGNPNKAPIPVHNYPTREQLFGSLLNEINRKRSTR